MLLLHRALRALGIDGNVGWTLVGRLASMAAGFVAIFPVTRYLTPGEQGYYYTFASITALQMLFELGLTQILVQVTSHEFPFLPEDIPVAAMRDHPHGRRLAYFAGFADRWYMTISMLFAAVLAPFGLIYFRSFGSLSASEWALPWSGLIVLTAINLYLSPRLAFVEGAGHPGKVAALRLSQTLIGYALLIGMLWAGLALWATLALPLVQGVLALRWLRRDRGVPDFFRRDARLAERQPAWRREILSLQWRVALSWVGGYLATLVFTPLLFAYQGAVVAGRWGLSFSVLSQVSALGASWTTARVPRFGELIARGDRPALDRQFRDAAIKTVLLVALACAALIAGVLLADRWDLSIADRVAGAGVLALMGAATVGAAVVFCLAVYVRAHKEEPLVPSSLVVGGLTAASAWVGAQVGVIWVALAYAAVTLLVSLPWRYAIYRRYRDRRAG